VLVENVPYERLTSGLVTQLLTRLESLAFAQLRTPVSGLNKDPSCSCNVECSALSCIASCLQTKCGALPEIYISTTAATTTTTTVTQTPLKNLISKLKALYILCSTNGQWKGENDASGADHSSGCRLNIILEILKTFAAIARTYYSALAYDCICLSIALANFYPILYAGNDNIVISGKSGYLTVS
jgi:hypothetical protein